MSRWLSLFSDGESAPRRKFESLASLERADIGLLGDICSRTVRVLPHRKIAGEGEEIAAPSLVVSGWAYSERTLTDGRRQVVSILLPGDTIGLLRRPRPRSASSVYSLTEAKLADATPLAAVVVSGCEEGLALACLRSEALEQVFMLDHVVRLGRQSASERLIHFFLEMRARLKLIGHCDAMRHDMPLRQDMLADVLGLSLVHLNRTLRQLRQDHGIEFGGGSLILPDPDRLAAQVGYKDPVDRCMDFVRPRPPEAPVRVHYPSHDPNAGRSAVNHLP